MSPQFWPSVPSRILSGVVSVPSATWVPVTFPAGFFSAAPRMSVTVADAGRAGTFTAVTASGCSVGAEGPGAAVVHWIAVQ